MLFVDTILLLILRVFLRVPRSSQISDILLTYEWYLISKCHSSPNVYRSGYLPLHLELLIVVKIELLMIFRNTFNYYMHNIFKLIFFNNISKVNTVHPVYTGILG